MLRLFQLKKQLKKLLITLVLTVAALPLAGGVFAEEWGLDNVQIPKGKLKKMTEHYSEGDIVHFYDKDGRKILRTYPDSKTRQKVELKMFYDRENRLIEVKCFLDGKLYYTERGVYADGLLRSVITSNAAGKNIISTTMLAYDDESRKLKNFGVQAAGGIIDYTYQYDKNGRMERIQVFFNGKPYSSAKYFYDSNGLVTQVLSYNARMQNSGVLKNKWQLDSRGNWINKESALYKNLKSKPVSVEKIKRTIEYQK